MAPALLEAYHAFAGSTEMDGRTFVKCMRDSLLIDEDFRTADADLVFAKCKARGSRKIDFAAFTRALAEVAARRGMTEKQVQDIICLAFGPDYETNASCEELLGPERFYYDMSLYTGVHKHGGPTLVGGGRGEGSPVNFKELVNRDRENELAASSERRRRGQPPSEDDSTSQPLPTLLGAERSPKTSPKKPVRVLPLRGPERFFYDKSSYTGTHKNGGPTTIGNGLQKEGYSNLSELVCRDHIQDDDLNRRNRWRRIVAEADADGSWSSSFDSPRQMLPPSAEFDVLPVLLGASRRLQDSENTQTQGKVPQQTGTQMLRAPAVAWAVPSGQLLASTMSVTYAATAMIAV